MTIHLSVPLATTVKRYNRMMAYGNHFRCEGNRDEEYNTFNSGVACDFNMGEGYLTNFSNVGFLRSIYVLNYGLV